MFPSCSYVFFILSWYLSVIHSICAIVSASAQNTISEPPSTSVSNKLMSLSWLYEDPTSQILHGEKRGHWGSGNPQEQLMIHISYPPHRDPCLCHEGPLRGFVFTAHTKINGSHRWRQATWGIEIMMSASKIKSHSYHSLVLIMCDLFNRVMPLVCFSKSNVTGED